MTHAIKVSSVKLLFIERYLSLRPFVIAHVLIPLR